MWKMTYVLKKNEGIKCSKTNKNWDLQRAWKSSQEISLVEHQINQFSFVGYLINQVGRESNQQVGYNTPIILLVKHSIKWWKWSLSNFFLGGYRTITHQITTGGHQWHKINRFDWHNWLTAKTLIRWMVTITKKILSQWLNTTSQKSICLLMLDIIN